MRGCPRAGLGSQGFLGSDSRGESGAPPSGNLVHERERVRARAPTLLGASPASPSARASSVPARGRRTPLAGHAGGDDRRHELGLGLRQHLRD